MSDFQDEHRRLGEQIDKLAAQRAFAPHCDQFVLHTPGECWSCDGYPDWQSARITWQINFTGQNDPNKAPCPAEQRRSLDTINRWDGNRASTGQTLDEYIHELKERAREWGEARAAYARPLLGSWNPPPSKFARLRRRVSRFLHHF